MQMPGRSFSSASYRYGFNGKENDNEVKGTGNQQDYGMRIYDSRVGKFLSVDPLYKSYAELTPYQFASNTPIQAIDLDGLEKFIKHYEVEDGKSIILSFATDNSLKYLGRPTVWNQPTVHPKVVQYIREDKNGKILSITGDIPLKNFGRTIYVGAFNPKYSVVDGKKLNGTDRYDYPAINSLDLAGKQHDMAYKKFFASGPMDAVGDWKQLMQISSL